MSRPPIRVLYLDHTARLSGAELALSRLLGALDRTRVEPMVLLAEDGPLRELLERGSIDTSVIALGDSLSEVRKDSLDFPGVLGQVRRLRSLWCHSLHVARFARGKRADLIYTNSLKSDFYGAFAGRLAGIPVVWHMHDRIDESYLPRMAVWLVRVLARTLPLCVVANSASTLETLKLGPDQSTEIIACGLTREHIERCSAREPSGDRALPHIGMVGRLAPWKGQDVFLEAAARLLRQGIRARFCIAGAALFGEASFERQLRDRVEALGLQREVEFLGFAAVPEVLRSLDVLVHASRIPEPFGQVIIEGLAAGLPVIATDGGGVREIIDHGRTGLLVPLGDAQALADGLTQLLADPERARALGAAGRRHVLEHFTVEKSARRSEALYARLLAIGA